MRLQPALILASALILPWAATAEAQMTEPLRQAPMSQAPMSQAPMGSSQSSMDTAAAENFLRQAREAVSAGRTQQARENLEQAETRLLTRSVMPSQAGTPMDRGAVSEISSAREALGRRDRSAVNRHIDQAMAQLRAPSPMAAPGAAPMTNDTATGRSMPMAPSAGGGTGAGTAPRTLGPAPAPMFQPGPMPAPGRM